MGGPSMHVSHEHAQRNVFAQGDDVREGVFGRGTVIKHQEDAGDREDQKDEKGKAAHTPRVAHADSVAFELRGMKMQEYVRENGERAITVCVWKAVPEDRLP